MKIRNIFIFCFLLVSASAFAQKLTAAIEGTITDNDSKPIPGVLVTASSPSLIGGSRISYTDASGVYRFPFLASGVYEVKAELNGFQTVSRKDIMLSTSNTLTLDFSLQFIQTEETVEVKGNPPMIDTGTTAVTTTIPPEIVSSQPRMQDIQSLMRLTPGVKDDLSAFGAPATENSYWIDGVNMTSSARINFAGLQSIAGRTPGNLLLQYDQNWIDQVQVTGIGAPSEFGGFTGVIGNFVTRSGGNEFHGLFETFFQNQHMVDTNRPDARPQIPFKTYDISAQLGGPILRDKLWFFVGFQYPHNEAFPLNNLSMTTDIAPKMFNKLTYKWNDNQTLQGFVQFNHGNREWTYFSHPEVSTLTKTPQWSWNTTWLSILGPNRTLEARLGGFYDNYNDIEDQPDLPGHVDLDPARSLNTNNCCRGRGWIRRFESNITFSQHAESFLHGAHDFRFGVQVERSDSFGGSYYNGGMFYYDFLGAPNTRTVFGGAVQEVTSNVLSGFAQDEWNITGRFTASLGFRWDHNRQATDHNFWYSNDQVAPRIGFVWKLDSKNETVIKAHYGHYFEGLQYAGGVGADGWVSGVLYQVYYQGKWYDGYRDHLNPSNIPHGLKQPFMRQFDIGVDRVLPGAVPIGVHYIRRQWEHMIQSINLDGFYPVTFINPVSGQPLTYYSATPGPKGEMLANDEGLFRHYNAIELYASKQLRHHFSVMGSFVYDRYRGSNSNINDGFYTQIDRNNFHPSFQPAPEDHYSWKISGTYPAPFGFNAGWYYRHESGTGWAAIIDTPDGGRVILGEPCCRGYLSATDLVDLRFEKGFPIYRGQLRFTIDLFNLFNAGTVTEVDAFWGRLNSPSPNFGEPVSYVDPRQYRLGVRYTF